MNADASTDCSRAEARRAQILAAASDCFRAHGFHGASISQISKTAGMSAGHIYHYFENKEAIIAAIVAHDLDWLLTLSASWRAADDVLEAMIDGTAEGVKRNLDRGTAGLNLEILAESSRNPEVAAIVQNASKRCNENISEILRLVRTAKGLSTDDATIATMIDVLGTMFEGVLARGVRSPDLDADRFTRAFQGAVRNLITTPGFPAAPPS